MSHGRRMDHRKARSRSIISIPRPRPGAGSRRPATLRGPRSRDTPRGPRSRRSTRRCRPGSARGRRVRRCCSRPRSRRAPGPLWTLRSGPVEPANRGPGCESTPADGDSPATSDERNSVSSRTSAESASRISAPGASCCQHLFAEERCRGPEQTAQPVFGGLPAAYSRQTEAVPALRSRRSTKTGGTGPGCEGASPGPAPHPDRALVSDRYTVERSRRCSPTSSNGAAYRNVPVGRPARTRNVADHLAVADRDQGQAGRPARSARSASTSPTSAGSPPPNAARWTARIASASAGPSGRTHSTTHRTASAAARPARRPPNRQPPRNVPSSAR